MIWVLDRADLAAALVLLVVLMEVAPSASAAFFRRAPIVTDTRLYPIFGQPVLDSSCGQKRRGAKKIMATSVTVTAFGNWFVFSDSRFLAKAGKGIKFS